MSEVPLQEDFDLFSLADIDLAWDSMVQLRYQQSVSLSGTPPVLSITCFQNLFLRSITRAFHNLF